MSSHSDSIQFLVQARELVDSLVQMQQELRSRVGQVTDLLARAVGDTALSAGMDQAQAAVGSHCDAVTQALMGLSGHIGDVLARMGGM